MLRSGGSSFTGEGGFILRGSGMKRAAVCGESNGENRAARSGSGEKRAPRSGSGDPTGDGREKLGVRRRAGGAGAPRSPSLAKSGSS